MFTCAIIPITDCKSLFIYAACHENTWYEKFRLLNYLYPDIPETKEMMDKYSTNIFTNTALQCKEGNYQSLVDTTNRINSLADTASSDLFKLTGIIDITVKAIYTKPVKSLLYTLAGATLVIGYFIHTTDKYYKAYQRCKGV